MAPDDDFLGAAFLPRWGGDPATFAKCELEIKVRKPSQDLTQNHALQPRVTRFVKQVVMMMTMAILGLWSTASDQNKEK